MEQLIAILNVTGITILILAGISLLTSIKVLKKHERGVVLTLGRFTGVKGPGLVLLMPLIQHLVKVDLNTRTVQDFEAMVSELRKPKRDMREIVDRHTDT